MIFVAIGCLSLSSLAYELLITRFFSIAHWNHLSFLAVGVAMFGYAAGGALYFVLGDRHISARTSDPRPLLEILLGAGALTTIGSFLIVKTLPLDYLRFPLDPWQPVYLLLACVVVSLPFLVSGFASCAGFAALPHRSGAISCAAFLGGAAGALAPALLLPLLAEGPSVVAVAAIPLVAVIAFGPGRPPRLAALLGVCAVVALAWSNPGFLDVEPCSYKALPLLLQAPGTRVSSRQSSLLGRLEEVRGPTIRFAPGLSLSFTGSLPAQTALIVDGDSLNVLYDLHAPGALDFATRTLSFAVHETARRVEEHDTCLVLQVDGGLGVACAMAAGYERVVVVNGDPRISARMQDWYRFAAVSAIAENLRTYLAATKENFSTIVIEDWGPSIPGMASLSEDALLTTDAIRACWNRLAEGGALSISRRLVLPPSDSVRLFAAAVAALRSAGCGDAALHVAVIRSWDSTSIILFRDPLVGQSLERLIAFTRSRGFDIDYSPGSNPAEANRFNRYERPIFADAYRSTLQDPRSVRGLDLDVSPQGDDRPFPSHFVKWTRIRDFYGSTGQRIYTLLLTGEVVAGAAFLESILLAAALLLATFLLAGRARPGEGPRVQGLFFVVAASGLGFMGTEMFVIDALAPLFSSPTVALSIALGALLSFSSLGGLASERLAQRLLAPALALGAAALILLYLLSPRIVERSLPLGFAGRFASVLGMTAIPGFLIGIPFAGAVRLLAASARERALSWAINGCASVAVSFASALLAPAAGIRSLLILAAWAYALAALALLIDSGRRRPYYRPP